MKKNAKKIILNYRNLYIFLIKNIKQIIILCFILILFPVYPVAQNYWPVKNWRKSTPTKQGFDNRLFSDLHEHIDQKMPHIQSTLIIRNGYLVFKYYRSPNVETTPNIIQCVTKSILSALVGVAIQEGYIKSIDQKMIDFFPEYNIPDLEPLTKKITIEHLLTMTAEFMSASSSVELKIKEGTRNNPGQKFLYDNGSIQVLVVLLARATGMSTMDFAKKYLFDPLGIKSVTWTKFKDGYYNGGNGLMILPKDMAKIGYLYLKKGNWKGKQIIPVDFVNNSIQKHNEGGYPENEAYGYLWWITTIEGYSAYLAAGYGGQYIIVIPELDMIITTTSNLDRHHYENKDILKKFIIPAIKK